MSSSSTYQSEVDPPSTGISDTTNFLCSMKRENDEVLANEDDNQDRSRSSQKHSDAVSRKRDEPEDKTKHQNEQSNSNKRSKVSVDVDTLPEPPASFNTLDDDCLGNVLEFVGKKCYSVFGRLNKRCHDIFCSKELPMAKVKKAKIEDSEDVLALTLTLFYIVNHIISHEADVFNQVFTFYFQETNYHYTLCSASIKT